MLDDYLKGLHQCNHKTKNTATFYALENVLMNSARNLHGPDKSVCPEELMQGQLGDCWLTQRTHFLRCSTKAQGRDHTGFKRFIGQQETDDGRLWRFTVNPNIRNSHRNHFISSLPTSRSSSSASSERSRSRTALCLTGAACVPTTRYCQAVSETIVNLINARI